MKTTKVSVLVLVLALLMTLGGSAGAQEPQALSAAGGCEPGTAYDPLCDSNRDGTFNITDIMLMASRWGQSGTWTTDSWLLAGNPGTDPATNFVGTTDDQPLIFKTSGAEAVRIDSAGNVGIGTSRPYAKLQVDTGGSGNGVRVDSTGWEGVVVHSAWDGVLVRSAGQNGVWVQSAVRNGVYVNSAGDDGVIVYSAGSPSTTTYSTAKNGFQVAGTQGNGLYVGRADGDGVRLDSAGDDSVLVASAGSPSTTTPSTDKNGFEVAGAQGNGLYVGRVDVDGVRVRSAGTDGVWVRSAGNIGVHVSSAGSYAGYFVGDIRVRGSCVGCTLAAFGRNAGQTPLGPGDVVAVRGITKTDLPHTPVVADVDRPSGSDAIIGVVAGRAELEKREGSGGSEAVERLVPREGPAQPGEYVNIVIYGLAQVKASALDAPIQAGTPLTAAGRGGVARAVRTVEVEGVQVAESVPILGTALEGLESGEGLIWVLVNPR